MNATKTNWDHGNVARARKCMLVETVRGAYAVDARENTLPTNHAAWDALAAAVDRGEMVDAIPDALMAFRIGDDSEPGAFGRRGQDVCMRALRELPDAVLAETRAVWAEPGIWPHRHVGNLLAGYIYDRYAAEKTLDGLGIPELAQSLLGSRND